MTLCKIRSYVDPTISDSYLASGQKKVNAGPLWTKRAIALTLIVIGILAITAEIASVMSYSPARLSDYMRIMTGLPFAFGMLSFFLGVLYGVTLGCTRQKGIEEAKSNHSSYEEFPRIPD